MKDDLLNAMLNLLSDIMGTMDYRIVLCVDANDYTVRSANMHKEFLEKMGGGEIIGQNFIVIGSRITAMAECAFKCLLNKMGSFAADCCNDSRNRIVFVSELPCRGLGLEFKATYKFCPVWVGESSAPYFFVASIGLPSGLLNGRLLAINNFTNEYQICDISNYIWKEWKCEPLSRIEKKVLTLSTKGMTIEEIGTRLNKAADSVKSIRKRIFQKLGVNNIAQALNFATTAGLI